MRYRTIVHACTPIPAAALLLTLQPRSLALALASTR